MNTILLFVILTTGQWFSFIPVSQEMNNMEACQKVGENLPVTNPTVPMVAYFCKSFTEEELIKFKIRVN